MHQRIISIFDAYDCDTPSTKLTKWRGWCQRGGISTFIFGIKNVRIGIYSELENLDYVKKKLFWGDLNHLRDYGSFVMIIIHNVYMFYIHRCH